MQEEVLFTLTLLCREVVQANQDVFNRRCIPPRAAWCQYLLFIELVRNGFQRCVIPTAISYDTFAQVLAAMDAMRSGIAMRVFQASQQASTISS